MSREILIPISSATPCSAASSVSPVEIRSRVIVVSRSCFDIIPNLGYVIYETIVCHWLGKHVIDAPCDGIGMS
jgi:hypothetical protein